jgi:hypothetical protein
VRARCVVPARDPRRRGHLLRNETLFRELNNAVERYFKDNGRMHGEFVCECSEVTCVEPMTLSPELYADIRAHPTRFFLVPGHEVEGLERTVEELPGVTIVETPHGPVGPGTADQPPV